MSREKKRIFEAGREAGARLAANFVTTHAGADPLPPTGAIVRRVESREMGTVLHPCEGGVEVEHGWIDEPPDRRRFTLTPELWTARVWRYATPLEAETFRRMSR